MSNRSSSNRLDRRIALAIAVTAAILTSGCMHVSQRAWDNGRAMTSSHQYRQVMNGDRSIGAVRNLYYRSNARLMYQRDVPFPYFGHW